MNRKYEKYVVVSSTRNNLEHGYSTKLGDAIAYRFAVDCAKHRTMQGTVYGVTADGDGSRYPEFQVKGIS